MFAEAVSVVYFFSDDAIDTAFFCLMFYYLFFIARFMI
jgi:hypothetical protein